MSDLPPMQYVKFGNTGLKVSRLCLGCMGFGSSEWFNWVLNEKESIEIISKAYEAGINFFDTANIYSNGESERVLGKAIKQLDLPRDRIVVATKVGLAVQPTPDSGFLPLPKDDPEFTNKFGLSRKHIFDAVNDSLERLQLDYIDLYQIHRMDPDTPWEETMEALNDLVKSGKVRYIGASSMPTHQFQKANYIAEKNGWVKFVSMQNLYNLIYREEEREMIPYCQENNIAVIPWSPLAGGLLTGKNRKTTRHEQSEVMMKMNIKTREERDNELIVDQLIAIANKRQVSPAQVALSWALSKPIITAPILGITKEKHLNDLVGALELKLTTEEIKSLEKLYSPRWQMRSNF